MMWQEKRAIVPKNGNPGSSTDFVRLAAEGANIEVCACLVAEEADRNALASESASADPLYVSLLSLGDILEFFSLTSAKFLGGALFTHIGLFGTSSQRLETYWTLDKNAKQGNCYLCYKQYHAALAEVLEG